MKLDPICTAKGLIIYHYDFENKKGDKIKTTKYLFNVNNLGIIINAKKDFDKPIGTLVEYQIGYDGSKWVIL